ncbi:asparagine synthetase B family protein [Hamadaea tsunoensis]|uniref:asparagine synthetase B family protein n=1 Tax=Hamadaea tsunoensis TaxID=53368 RepID=UPI000413C6D2|nr:asparagine synthase-related protein [Hamadaea tsunoensis]
MCGIALVLGAGADADLFDRMLGALAARGEVSEVACADDLLAGTQRLRIVDREHAVQPWTSPDGTWLLCFNGEIFNHRELRADLTAAGRLFGTESDTEVVLEAFRHWGAEAVRHFRGEYAFAAVERPTGRVYLARDPLGVKPLYWSRTGDRLHIASEAKALVPAGAPIREVPPGHHGWASAVDGPALAPYIDLGFDEPLIEDLDEAVALVRAAVVDAIRVRVDTDLTVGVILSGGLDSSLTLHEVRKVHPDCVAFTIGAPDSPDLAYARRLTADLGVRHEIIEVRPGDIRLPDIREAIRLGELTEYGDIINAVVSVPLFRRVHEAGVKVVLTGDGSDELFGGYSMYRRVPPVAARRLFLHKIRNLSRTELQRVDRASMGQGVEARVPFLDLALVRLALRLPVDVKVRDGVEKWILRQAFRGELPEYILNRPKNPMSYSSGLHERARLYKPLFARLHRSYGYDLLEPVRRDFDTLLARSGYDLDRLATVAPDYTVWEHARDLLGALRWNAFPPRRPS